MAVLEEKSGLGKTHGKKCKITWEHRKKNEKKTCSNTLQLRACSLTFCVISSPSIQGSRLLVLMIFDPSSAVINLLMDHPPIRAFAHSFVLSPCLFNPIHESILDPVSTPATKPN